MRLDHLPRPFPVLIRFALHDEVRLFEIYSVLNLLIWGAVFWGGGHGLLPTAAPAWGLLLLSAAVVQMLAMVLRHMHIARLRFPAMAFAAGVWTAFGWATGQPEFILTALCCAFAGAFLGWKPIYFPS